MTENKVSLRKDKVSIQKEEEINLIPDNVIQKILKTHSKERPIYSFDLTFEDGINLAWDIIFEIINREDDKADNMGGILCDYISEALQKIIDDLSNKRIKQLYKHFNIELDR